MLIGVAKETWPGEVRTALVPANATKLIKSGFSIAMQSGAGAAAGFTDESYADAGVTIMNSRAEVMAAADIFLAVRKPDTDEVAQLKASAISVSFLDPYNEKALIEALAAKGVTSISMEMIPRSTRAQKMDALSSQANLAGYVTVVQAAFHSPKIMPMMMTPAGTIAPARVFVIGAGVAGLQAIATAKRLGARVEAFDTRPVVAEQVQSLGAKFVEIDLGEVGQTEQGYAKELTPEQLELQREGQKAVIAQSDVVITTAQLFGRAAPVIVGRDMVEAMKPGSVVVDMAVESGGNVEGSVMNEVVDINGVKVVGQGNLPGEVARNASEMYSNNLLNLLQEFWDEEAKTLNLDPEDDIVQSCVITRDGAVVNETIKNIYSGA
ncbi:MAG: Re/Si-specific NAD(P)(+) transhydrogenase subunit alpha [Pseudomonadota bacterium]|jgi:NAD(P) transhydrogenase subunit alpha|nr:Re/Si-specific NAD(P)(+) transhydrogenase subunit alpha [Pseudomonadota bacterium]MEC7413332.1 Re/Si-specific NAD(P)(+) transhydrogenase subunit alpha [Pseudomonadota bacterium]MEC7955858.1 Re/Si-specific NAD(P)(+) transhydrogenase subunit alpha [Pseudomonadota bacterium]MEC8697323.1 Re/Si-specific NAD(P)(+) transhydrogenase subunit alpha [Pseudomonadota bacterium]MEC8807868.1 Re/Si-specific NAD(P)(+) transhydrogenase subunit alpha [Pseudomonadota bacterium]